VLTMLPVCNANCQAVCTAPVCSFINCVGQCEQVPYSALQCVSLEGNHATACPLCTIEACAPPDGPCATCDVSCTTPTCHWQCGPGADCAGHEVVCNTTTCSSAARLGPWMVSAVVMLLAIAALA
jgi:hypothetical protein